MTRPPRQYYDDGQVQLDRFALTLRRYHFPSGTAKVIPLQAIKGYKAEPLGLLLPQELQTLQPQLLPLHPISLPGLSSVLPYPIQ